MSKRKSTSRRDLSGIDVPEDCHKIILQQNNSKIVIHNKAVRDESRNALLAVKLQEFFDESKNWMAIAPILQQKNKISLRLLDWLATNYSKKQNLMLTTHRNGVEERVNLFLDYNSNINFWTWRNVQRGRWEHGTDTAWTRSQFVKHVRSRFF